MPLFNEAFVYKRTECTLLLVRLYPTENLASAKFKARNFRSVY